jgi:hypothetical protein
MKKIIYIFLLVLVIGVASYVFVANSSTTYTDSQYKFSFTLPKGWTVSTASKDRPTIAWQGNVTYAINLVTQGEDYYSIIVVTDEQLKECDNAFTEKGMCPMQVIVKKGNYSFAETHFNGDVDPKIDDVFYKKILPSFRVD